MRHQATQTRAVADDAEQRAGRSNGTTSFGVVIQSGNFVLVNGVSPAVPAPGVVGGLGASKVLLTILDPAASTALGLPAVVTTPGVGFQVTSKQVAAPGLTEMGDQSVYSYVIINPVAG